MREPLHVFFTDEGDGWSVESPGIPGFAMGRRTLAALRADLPVALRFAGAFVAPIEAHIVERFVTIDDDEYSVRAADDLHRVERREVAQRLRVLLQTDQRFELMQAARTRTAGAVFVCGVATDTLGWLRDQLRDGDDAVTVALAVAQSGLFSTQLSNDPQRADLGWTWVDKFGWTEATTLAEVMVALSGRPENDRLLITG